MPDRTYVIRRFIAVRDGYVVHETSVVELAEARYAASHHAANCLGVVVLDPERGTVKRYGDVPEEM